MLFVKEPLDTTSLYSLLESYFEKQCPATYNSPECSLKELTCYKGKNRSFLPLLELSQTYFKDCTEKDVAKTLRELCGEGKLYWSFCCDVEKVVFYKREGPPLSRYELDNYYNWKRYNFIEDENFDPEDFDEDAILKFCLDSDDVQEIFNTGEDDYSFKDIYKLTL